jgi:hypothetical protein
VRTQPVNNVKLTTLAERECHQTLVTSKRRQLEPAGMSNRHCGAAKDVSLPQTNTETIGALAAHGGDVEEDEESPQETIQQPEPGAGNTTPGDAQATDNLTAIGTQTGETGRNTTMFGLTVRQADRS